VCDAFDAMISDRSHKSGMTVEEALAELRRCAGTPFDGRVVGAFCELTRERPGLAVEA
jgi:HD-GYP domain-containing protein (c-di-GMP phosphodiesterase class II)